MTKTWRLTRRKFLIGLGTLTGGVAVGLPLGLPYLRRQAFNFLSQGGPPSGNIDGDPELWYLLASYMFVGRRKSGNAT